MASSEVLPRTLRGGTERNHEKPLVLSMFGKRTEPEAFHLRSSRTDWLLERYVLSVCNGYTHCVRIVNVNAGP